MRKLWSSLGAAGVLVAGALVAVAVVGTMAVAQEDPGEGSIAGEPPVRRHAALLDEALAELVNEGVIDEAVADQVRERVALKARERSEEFEGAFRTRPRHGLGHLRDFVERHPLAGALEDGVLDADELDQFFTRHPLLDPDGPFARFLDEALEDGQVTTEEIEEGLAELRESLDGHGFDFHRHPFRPFERFRPDTAPDVEQTG